MTATALHVYHVLCPKCRKPMWKEGADLDLFYCMNHECELLSKPFRVQKPPSTQIEMIEEPDQEVIGVPI